MGDGQKKTADCNCDNYTVNDDDNLLWQNKSFDLWINGSVSSRVATNFNGLITCPIPMHECGRSPLANCTQYALCQTFASENFYPFLFQWWGECKPQSNNVIELHCTLFAPFPPSLTIWTCFKGRNEQSVAAGRSKGTFNLQSDPAWMGEA